MDDRPLIRVERGNPSEADLAAVVAVLMAICSRDDGSDDFAPTVVRWHRPERRQAFIAAHSWAA